MKITMQEMGKNLKYAREEKGISIYKIEKELGISHQNMYNYENGKIEPSIMQIIKLAEYYEISIEKLVFLKY